VQKNVRTIKTIIAAGLGVQMLVFALPYVINDSLFGLTYTSHYYNVFKAALTTSDNFFLTVFLCAPVIFIPIVFAIMLFPDAVVTESKKSVWASIASIIAIVPHIVLWTLVGSDAAYGLYIGLFLSLGLLILSLASLISLKADGRAVSGRANTTPQSRRSNAENGEIIGVEGGLRGHKFDAPSGKAILLGRDEAVCHIKLSEDAEKVSRKHCSVLYDGQNQRFLVTDYSSNGTFLQGGQRIEHGKTITVPRGMIICLGDGGNSFLLR
jgi:hypothetical protein